MAQTHLHHSTPRLCNYWEHGAKTCAFVFVVHDDLEKMTTAERRAFKFDMLEKGAMSNLDGGVIVPACKDCLADHFCRAVRINHQTFELSPSQRKKMEQFHENCAFIIATPAYDPSLLLLYKNYIRARHGNTGTSMVEHTADNLKNLMGKAQWMVIAKDRQSRELVSFALIDQHGSSFCLEYLAYDLDKMKLSPGVSTIVTSCHLLQKTFPEGHMYLGSWSPGSPKLGYKNQFAGLEVRATDGWVPLQRNAGAADAPKPPTIMSFVQQY